MIRRLLAVLSAAALVGAAPAHADEGGYLAALQAAGVPVVIQATAISTGYTVCGQIRGGESPATAAQQWGIYSAAWGPAIVDAAQHNLCPDTLH